MCVCKCLARCTARTCTAQDRILLVMQTNRKHLYSFQTQLQVFNCFSCPYFLWSYAQAASTSTASRVRVCGLYVAFCSLYVAFYSFSCPCFYSFSGPCTKPSVACSTASRVRASTASRVCVFTAATCTAEDRLLDVSATTCEGARARLVC